jgi:hypothetical protein
MQKKSSKTTHIEIPLQEDGQTTQQDFSSSNKQVQSVSKKRKLSDPERDQPSPQATSVASEGPTINKKRKKKKKKQDAEQVAIINAHTLHLNGRCVLLRFAEQKIHSICG